MAAYIGDEHDCGPLAARPPIGACGSRCRWSSTPRLCSSATRCWARRMMRASGRSTTVCTASDLPAREAGDKPLAVPQPSGRQARRLGAPPLLGTGPLGLSAIAVSVTRRSRSARDARRRIVGMGPRNVDANTCSLVRLVSGVMEPLGVRVRSRRRDPQRLGSPHWLRRDPTGPTERFTDPRRRRGRMLSDRCPRARARCQPAFVTLLSSEVAGLHQRWPHSATRRRTSLASTDAEARARRAQAALDNITDARRGLRM